MLAESIVASGGLLPDDVMLKVVTSKLDALHNQVSGVDVPKVLRVFITCPLI